MKRSKQNVLDIFVRTRLVAIVRTEDSTSLIDVARALCEGGIPLVEITMTVPGALDVIRQAAAELDDGQVCLGAGTVLDPQTAEEAIAAGAEFIIAPTLNIDTVEF